MRPRGRSPRRWRARFPPARAQPPQAACAAAPPPARASVGSRAPGELVELRAALLAISLAALLRFLGGVEQKVRVVGQLLDAGQAVLVRVEAGLHEAQRERGEGEHVAAPLDRLLLEIFERDNRVDEAHLKSLLRVVLPAQHPDLLGALLPDLASEHRGAEASVPGADARAGLAKARVVGGDR